MILVFCSVTSCIVKYFPLAFFSPLSATPVFKSSLQYIYKHLLPNTAMLSKGFREVFEWYCLFHPSLLVYTYLNSKAGFLDLTSDSVTSCIWVIFSVVHYIFSQIDGFIL